MKELNIRVLKKTIFSTITYIILMMIWNIFVQDQKGFKAVMFTLLTGMAVGAGFYFIYRWEYRRLMKKKGIED